MRITTSKNSLLKPLLMASNIVERRQTLPILANFLLKIINGRFFIVATDLEVELSTSIPIEATQDIEFTLPARKLVDICKALPDESKIDLLVDDTRVVLSAGRGKYTMGLLPASDYPVIDSTTQNQVFHVPQITLRRLINKTIFAIAQQDVRYYLNGLLLEISKNKIRAVATDGHRLALCDCDLDIESNIDSQIILPRKAVVELGKLLNESDSVMKINLSNSYIQVTVDDSCFTSKLIDGRFPEYERVMPSGKICQMVVEKKILKQALIRTSVLSNEKYRGIRFTLEDNLLILEAHNSEQDEAKEEIEVEYNDEKFNMGFNVSYLLDVLNVIDGDKINMIFAGVDSSCLITSTESDECRYIVMPMRL